MENKQNKQVEISVIKSNVNKQSGIGQATIIGNLYGMFDGFDIVENGSAKRSLLERTPIILDSHNAGSVNSILAKTESAYEVDRQWLLTNAPTIVSKFDPMGIRGKGVTGALVLDISFAMDDEQSASAYKKLARGWFNGASLGFVVHNSKNQTVTLNNGSVANARLISSMTVYEVSLTPFPQNSGSQAISIRSANNSKREKGLREINKLIADLDKQAAVKSINRQQRLREIGILESDLLLSQLDRDMNRQ